MSARLVWKGDQVLAKVQDATREAIDETTEEAAAVASTAHWWSTRSGNLSGEVTNEAARGLGSRIKGRFGTTKGAGFYGLFLERRTPFLRPAADVVFRHLAANIRKRL